MAELSSPESPALAEQRDPAATEVTTENAFWSQALATQSATTTSTTIPTDASLQLAPPAKSAASAEAGLAPPQPETRPAAEASAQRF